MPKRGITDEEIGLIKTMLAWGMRNRDIQFYFNRQDRPVNSGRISQIGGGTYGAEVPAAEDAAVDEFLATFAHAEVGVVIDAAARPARQTLADRAREHFVRREDGHWYLADGETAEHECKEGFDPKKLTPIIRAVAALANNRGGFIVLGVSNSGCRAVGLPDDTFANTDIATIADKIKTYLTPTPVFSKDVIDLDGVQIGVIHVEKHSLPPVIVCRDGDGLDDGTILFRYPGQSGRIKYGDLLAMLRERDRSAHAQLLSRAARLSEIGTDRALIVDTREGTMDAGETRITIDQELADQLEFIREGEFEEREGAPTLRLIGDVRAVDATGQVRERIEGRALTPDMVVKAYLSKERVSSPLEYVCVSALTQRQWLPLHYFVTLSGQHSDDAIDALERTQASNQQSKQRALERLRGDRSAYASLSGQAVPVGGEIQAGQIDGICERHQPVLVARAIQGLPDGFDNVPPLLELLDGLRGTSNGDATLRGAIYRAASRLDEIEALAEQPPEDD
ncbi:AlbA family DNA-binding domain-containing protein [Mesorhizobium amorphae]|uniref:AlbA family DNA-binding domain-containing protein n=1 Tax=Mesorhizobium amorphae TaxID=71433 RepID=UPI001786F913|nr:ATP-binding protein [Mesorhizobium amorphae]